MGKVIDLTGQRFERLTVIEQAGFEKNGNALWLCICSCGNKHIAPAHHLKAGNIQSCGCLQKETISRINSEKLVDLTGEVFGKLIVTGRSDNNKYGTSMWECICDCGNKVIIVSSHLQKYGTKSCGCLSESWIASELKKYFVENYDGITEYKIFKNVDNGYWLPYDIYLPYEKVFIEIHGSQHYGFIPYWHKTKENFKYQQKKDRMKRKFARQNGTYIEVDLRKTKTIERAIENIEKGIK